MKKLFVLISIILILCLTGCGVSDNTSSDLETNGSLENVSSVIEETTSEESISEESPSEDISQKTELSSEVVSEIENSSNNVSSVTNNSNSSTNKNEYIYGSYLYNTETGEKIEGSEEYLDKYGNVYDEQGNFLYNLNEWGDFYYTYEK